MTNKVSALDMFRSSTGTSTGSGRRDRNQKMETYPGSERNKNVQLFNIQNFLTFLLLIS